MTSVTDSLPTDLAAAHAIIMAQREALAAAEARASAAESEAKLRALEIEKLKYTIAKLRQQRFGQSSERSALLEQLELRLSELQENASEAEVAAQLAAEKAKVKVQSFERCKPARRPLPEHLPRERIVYPSPSVCPCCGGALHKLGEDVTETLELVPRQWKVVQHVREKFSCRTCEAITQPPAPSHPIARGRAGPGLLAHILFAKYGLHLPLNRQSETYAREGINLDVSTLADWVGACAATLMPLVVLIRAYVFAAERIHADDTPVKVKAKDQCRTGRLWSYVRDDRPFSGPDPPAAVFFYSPDRSGKHPEEHLASYAGLMQADAYSGFNRLYNASRQPGRSSRHHAGRTRGASCSNWRATTKPRLRSRRSSGSMRCSRSSARSTACRRMNASGASVPECWLGAVAAYFPLASLPRANLLIERCWSSPAAELVARQVREVHEERQLRGSIPRLTTIDDSVSLAVRQQYEEIPYPRWMKSSPVVQRAIETHLRQLFPVVALHEVVKTNRAEILVAGCGTGQHSVETARRFPEARVLAVDLSLSSVCYAERKTRELGVKNIEHAQADILKLQSIGRTFDVIEAVGILHHLAQPLAGWQALLSILRPGGFMRLGLYSKRARQDVTAARALTAQRGYAPSAEDIRRCRHELTGFGDGSPLSKIADRLDFFSTSPCRDLLFHVQEHQFTLPQIDDFLRQNRLEFRRVAEESISTVRLPLSVSAVSGCVPV